MCCHIHIVLKCSIPTNHVLMTCTDVYNVGKCFSVQALYFMAAIYTFSNFNIRAVHKGLTYWYYAFLCT